MKKLVIFLFLPAIFGFTNPEYKDKSIILHFQDILNEYRTSKNLSVISVDESIKSLTDERSKSISVNYSHMGFKDKVTSLPLKFNFAGENIAMVRNIPPNNKPYYSSNINEIGDIMNKMSMGIATNHDIALYCFLLWKHSKDHNDLLLDDKIKRFHLSYEKSETFYYFCFVALD